MQANMAMPGRLIGNGKNTASPIGFGFALAVFLSFVRATAAQDEDINRAGVIGLLTVQALVGGEPCKEPPPRQIPLHAAPESRDVVGWIRADKDESSDADCYRVVLNVHRQGTADVHELPTEEYEEEEPHAAIVLEARGRWFKLRLNDNAAWVEAPAAATYFSLEQLLSSHAAHLTEAWDGRLSATAAGDGRRPPADPRRHVLGYVEPVKDVAVRAFERPDPHAPVAVSFQAGRSDGTLRSTSSNPPQVAVFDRRPGWLQVAIRHDEWRDGWSDKWYDEPRAWIEDSPVWRFHAFAADPEREEFANDVLGPQFSSARLVGSRTVGGRLWLRVELTSDSENDPDHPPRVLARGWVPAHDPTGQPVLWFYTRD